MGWSTANRKIVGYSSLYEAAHLLIMGNFKECALSSHPLHGLFATVERETVVLRQSVKQEDIARSRQGLASFFSVEIKNFEASKR